MQGEQQLLAAGARTGFGIKLLGTLMHTLSHSNTFNAQTVLTARKACRSRSTAADLELEDYAIAPNQSWFNLAIAYWGAQLPGLRLSILLHTI